MARTARQQQLLDEIVELFLAEGFRHMTTEDLASRLSCSKTTLYQLAASREQLIVVAVRYFFKRAAERIDQQIASVDVPVERIGAYLAAIADELAPASEQFHADLDEFVPAREIYVQNTAIAARNVQHFVQEAAPHGGHINARFVGVVAGEIMEAIQRGRIEAMTDLDDAAAYRELANLIVSGVTNSPRQESL